MQHTAQILSSNNLHWRETNQPSIPFQSPTTTTVQEAAGTVSMATERSRDGGKRPAEMGEEV